ncbi:MAG: antibiotic biosynthesis monooxygenase [Terriglobales bacterium]
MFARVVELTPKPEMKDEILNIVRKEVLPILNKQQGFMEFLPFVPEPKTERWITISLWAEKQYAERWEREGFPKVEGILKLFLAAPPICNHYTVETSFASTSQKVTPREVTAEVKSGQSVRSA